MIACWCRYEHVETRYLFYSGSKLSVLALDAWAADAGNLSGNWEYVEYVDGSSKPYSTFEIKLNETSDGAVTGSYCFIMQSGNRIDCGAGGAKNIAGHVDEDGRHASVSKCAQLSDHSIPT